MVSNFRQTMEVNNPPWVHDFLDPARSCPTDQDKMRLAVALARENVLRGTGGPFGAAVFEEPTGALVSAGVNGVVRLNTGTAHAEVVAIMLAHGAVGRHTLRGVPGGPFTLASSCDPCAMCLGAVLWSGASRLLCGAAREDASALGFDEGPVFEASYDHLKSRGVAVVRGLLRGEAQEVLRQYRERGGPIYNG